jgi:uncharacterized membrane protein
MFRETKTPAVLGLTGSVLGLVFAGLSTLDYARHLDRKLHDVHCSLIPGLAAGADGENACRTAMYSIYAALFRGHYWGGVPVSLFALGAFSFFAAFALYLLVSGAAASRKSYQFFAITGTTPLLVSLVMFFISVTQLGTLCKTCIGIYVSSAILALGALWGLRDLRAEPAGALLRPILWLGALGAVTAVPALVYVSALPNHRPYIGNCGKLAKTVESHGALLKMKTSQSRTPATIFEDPLCPTCKAFHQRIAGEGALDRLDVQEVLFPLDSDCNWMLTEALHKGACTLSKAVICGGERVRTILEWAYDEQESLAKAGKAGDAVLRERIKERWGADILPCIDSPATKARLNNHLHFASDNSVPVSTPQLYLGDKKVCDEDTDLGLRYTLTQMAPEVVD